MEARLLLGSDDAQSDSGHGSDEGWEGQGIAARQAAAALGCGARLLRELQGTMGGGEYEVVCWPTLLPCFYKNSLVADGSFMRLFATPSEFGHFGLPAAHKNFEFT